MGWETARSLVFPHFISESECSLRPDRFTLITLECSQLPWSNLSMSVGTPTVLPRPPLFPNLMPRPQQPYPTPLVVPGRRAGRFTTRRDLVQEMDDLSDEEAELEDSVRTSSPHALSFFF
jgi:hypothetical protein